MGIKDFTFDSYSKVAKETAIYPPMYMKAEDGTFHEVPLIYATLGLASEAGEVAGKVKKVIRDCNGVYSPQVIASLIDEIGDNVWYLATLADELKSSLAYAAIQNNVKLLDRMKRNVLGGSGDER